MLLGMLESNLVFVRILGRTGEYCFMNLIWKSDFMFVDNKFTVNKLIRRVALWVLYFITVIQAKYETIYSFERKQYVFKITVA